MTDNARAGDDVSGGARNREDGGLRSNPELGQGREVANTSTDNARAGETVTVEVDIDGKTHRRARCVYCNGTGEAEQDFAAHDAGYVVNEVEETEAMTDACTGCGATEDRDGWTRHPADCSTIALSPEAEARIAEKVESVRQARLAAMEGAHGYVIG